MKPLYAVVVLAAAIALVAFDAPSWLALGAGLAIALATRVERPKPLKVAATWALQLGVIGLGAGMNLGAVLREGLDGALVTATSLALAVSLGIAVGRRLAVARDTSLMLAIGTGICGGSAIAAIASVIRPKDHEISVALAVVFVLNAIGLVLFPVLGHAFGMDQVVFGRWAALAIHDTSSVVGAGLVYGPIALTIATTTKLARALWIVPVTIATAVLRNDGRGRLRDVAWPWFILGFVAVAALVTWVPALAPYAKPTAAIGRRILVLALFLIGLALSPSAVAKVGARPFVAGVLLWLVVAAAAVPLAIMST